MNITVKPLLNEYVMNQQGEWDCKHVSAHKEDLAVEVSEDEISTIQAYVCDGCPKYLDERTNEWTT